MALTEFTRNEIGGSLKTAVQRTKSVADVMANALQAVRDARANYLAAKSGALGAGLTEAEFDTEYGNPYTAVIGEVNAQGTAQLIMLLAEVSRRTGVSPQAALSQMASVAPATIPTDEQTVQVNQANGTIEYV